MSLTITRSAAGIALLTALAAGCGSAGTTPSQGTQPKPASPAATATHPAAQAKAAHVVRRHHHRRHHHHAAPSVAPTTAPASPPPMANPIPQGNGGDHDADNNGGPSDGDGDI